MMEPAFFTKEEPRSYMDFRMSIGRGRWYAGSSITNGAGSPANHFVFFSTIPEKMMAAMPRKYADGAIQEAPPNTAPARRAMIGSFAEHGMKVVVIIVIRRSRSFSIVLEAIIPGTPQPVPISIGMNDLPERPNLRNIRSSTNAIRAI